MAANHEATELLEIVTTRAADFSRKAADDLYACLLEATQDYLIDNARFNIGERIAAAERQARHDREAWGKAETRVRVLLGALRKCRTQIAGFTNTEGAADQLFNEPQRIHNVACAAVAKAEGRS